MCEHYKRRGSLSLCTLGFFHMETSAECRDIPACMRWDGTQYVEVREGG
jgi:hypothetical protein